MRGADLDAHWQPIWDSFNVLNHDSESPPMAVNVFHAAIVPLIANKESMFVLMRKKVKTSFVPRALVAEFVRPFVHVVY